MKKLILRTIAFLLTFFSILMFSDVLISHEGTSNTLFLEKLKHFNEHQDDYDTIFIGTSLTYRQVDPFLFDEITARRSFNFGRPSMQASEKINSLLSMLDSGLLDNIDYVICEGGFFYKFPATGLKERLQEDALYFYSFQDFYNELFFLTDTAPNLNKWFEGFTTISEHFLKSRIKIRPPAVRSKLNSEKLFAINQNKGFFSLDNQYLGKIHERRIKFLKKPEYYVAKYVNASQKAQTPKRKNLTPPQALLTKYYSLIDRFNEHGIMLVYLFFPNHTKSNNPANEKYYTSSIISQLPQSQVLDMTDVSQMPELSHTDHFYDENHLNSRGSHFLTTYIAKEMLNLKRIIN